MTRTETKMQTNQVHGIKFDEGFLEIDKVFGTGGANPLVSIVPGMKAGSVNLHISESTDKPDVITIAALFDPRTYARIVTARIEQSIIRGLRTESELRTFVANAGFRIYLNRNYEEGKKGELRYHIGMRRGTKSISEMKSLTAVLSSKIEEVGKTQNIAIRHRTEVDSSNDPPEFEKVTLRSDKLEDGVASIVKKFDTDTISQLVELLNAVQATGKDATDQIESDDEVEETAEANF